MTNIQKAIKFAESEIKSLELAPEINGCEMTEEWREQIEIWKTAISALEKQIPKKPYLDNDNGIYEKEHCPTCHRGLFPNDHHCRCGQALDWSDTK